MGTLKFSIKSIALSMTLLSLVLAGADQRPQTHTVMIKNFAFVPNNLTVSIGDTVVWKNEDSAPHTATTDIGFRFQAARYGPVVESRGPEKGQLSLHLYVSPLHEGLTRDRVEEKKASGTARS